MSAATLMNLTQNPEKWQEFCEICLISASGTNSDLSEIFHRMTKLKCSVEGKINGE
jgi:hypothetical protein